MDSIFKKWYVWIPFVVVVFLFFYFFSVVLIYIFIALILSFLGHPLFSFLEKLKIGKLKIPRALNALIALFSVIGFFVIVVILLTPFIIQQAQLISEIDIYAFLDSFKEPINNLEDWMREYNLIAETETIESIISDYLFGILQDINVKNIVSSVFGMIGSLSIGIFSSIFMAFFFMKDDKLLYKGLKMFTPRYAHDEIARILVYSKRMLSRYFLGLLFEQLIMISIITLGMHLIGLPNALLIGLIAGVFNIIPYIGPIIGDLLGLIIGLTTLQGADFMSESLPLILKMLGVFIVANLIDNFVLQPLIYSKSVKAHPLEIFLVVIMAGMIAGIPGMILAIPAYTLIRIIAMEFFSMIPSIRQMTESLNTELQKKNKEKHNKEPQ